MASINVHNLNPIGSDLFADSESYLKELSETELNQQGGLFWATLVSPVTITFWYL
jgi:hypothetical protein